LNNSHFYGPGRPDIAALQQLLSVERFETFLKNTDSNYEEAVNLYIWNIAISSSLWGNFHLLEVSLRNLMSREITIATGRTDWWSSNIAFDEDTKIIIQKAVTSAKKRHPHSLEHGHVVAEFGLGFWVVLLSNRYHARLWEPILRKSFSDFNGRRKDIHRALEQLRKLRNRVAHHEPIYNRNLADDYKLIQWLLGLMDPEVGQWINSQSRFVRLFEIKQSWISGSAGTYF